MKLTELSWAADASDGTVFATTQQQGDGVPAIVWLLQVHNDLTYEQATFAEVLAMLRLAAAAPKLLASLKALLALVEPTADNEGVLLDTAMAIAEAEGQ